MKKSTVSALAALAAVLPLGALAPVAAADGMPGHREVKLHATLDPIKVNRVTASGTAMVRLTGNEAHVTVKASGLLAGAPHAQHFHIAAKGVCPPDSAAREHNGKLSLNTTDGRPFYGMIGTSLTTRGDTSPASGLAVDRFPAGPNVHYQRTITVSDAAAKSLRAGTAVVVVHGIDYNGNGKYDNVLGASDLDPKLPAEATNPALCGALKKSPHGAVRGGEGGTQSGEDMTLAASGGVALLIASGGAFYLRRRTGLQR